MESIKTTVYSLTRALTLSSSSHHIHFSQIPSLSYGTPVSFLDHFLTRPNPLRNRILCNIFGLQRAAFLALSSNSSLHHSLLFKLSQKILFFDCPSLTRILTHFPFSFILIGFSSRCIEFQITSVGRPLIDCHSHASLSEKLREPLLESFPHSPFQLQPLSNPSSSSHQTHLSRIPSFSCGTSDLLSRPRIKFSSLFQFHSRPDYLRLQCNTLPHSLVRLQSSSDSLRLSFIHSLSLMRLSPSERLARFSLSYNSNPNNSKPSPY